MKIPVAVGNLVFSLRVLFIYMDCDYAKMHYVYVNTNRILYVWILSDCIAISNQIRMCVNPSSSSDAYVTEPCYHCFKWWLVILPVPTINQTNADWPGGSILGKFESIYNKFRWRKHITNALLWRIICVLNCRVTRKIIIYLLDISIVYRNDWKKTMDRYPGAQFTILA